MLVECWFDIITLNGPNFKDFVKICNNYLGNPKRIPTFVIPNGALAERLGTGLQNLLQRFDSARHLSNEADPKGLVSFFYIGCRRVVGRLRQSSASLHPPSGTSFLREPLTRPRPATLCRSLPATTQLTSLPVFQQQVPYFEPACAWTLLYKQHTS